MNEPNEATHYQIELTSRQVLTALVVLLVCLFTSFFAGVWIGRNAEAEEAALEMASVDPVARAGERFDFFSRTDPAPGTEGGGKGAGAAADPAESSLDDDFLRRNRALDEADFGPDPDDQEIDPAGIEDDPLFEDDSALAADDGELPPPEEMGRGGRRRRQAAQPGGEVANPAEGDPAETPGRTETPARTEPPRAAPTPPPAEPAAASAPAASAARSAASSESGHFIQVLATADRDKATALVDRLVDADFKAFVVPSDEGGRAVYRVRVGPFSDRALATRQASELKTRWGLDSWIPPGAP